MIKIFIFKWLKEKKRFRFVNIEDYLLILPYTPFLAFLD